jgi:hypothetical protein
MEVAIDACDVLGNTAETFRYRFAVRDVLPQLPAQTTAVDPHPNAPGDMLSVTLDEGANAGAYIEFSDSIPVRPFFGPESELPAGPGEIFLSLQPAAVFPEPVKITIPLDGEDNIKLYEIYHYDANPDLGWRLAVVGDGWLEDRVNRQTENPPSIDIWVNHFTGLGLNKNEADIDGGGGGGGGSQSCFIATASYGSCDAREVLIFRKFRDRYLLSSVGGRVFVKTYYAMSPPLADIIARHDSLRTATRWCLAPFALVCEYTLKYPVRSGYLLKSILVALAISSLVLFALRNRRERS